jgi:hypothetical protein
MTTTRPPQTEMLIDSAMPVFDVAIAEHVLVHADPAATFAAARSLDFLTVRTPLVSSAMWLRGLPSRLSGKPIEPPGKLVLADGDDLPGWLVLGETPGRELAFGAVGKFWQPDIEWHDVPRAEFAEFAEPGWGKIAADFAVLPYRPGVTLLTYECRTVTTDPVSRRRFLRYWWLVRPFAAHIMRAGLRTVQANAETSGSNGKGER